VTPHKPHLTCAIRGMVESCEERGTLFLLGISLCCGRERMLWQCRVCYEITSEEELHFVPSHHIERPANQRGNEIVESEDC
jgi:hypothetical protein